MKSQETLANTTRLGPVHLRVVDIPAALPVWRDVVGVPQVGRRSPNRRRSMTPFRWRRQRIGQETGEQTAKAEPKVAARTRHSSCA